MTAFYGNDGNQRWKTYITSAKRERSFAESVDRFTRPHRYALVGASVAFALRLAVLLLDTKSTVDTILTLAFTSLDCHKLALIQIVCIGGFGQLYYLFETPRDPKSARHGL